MELRMNKLEFVFKTLTKFLAIDFEFKILKKFYDDNIPKDKLMTLLEKSSTISTDYLLENLPSSEDENYWEYEAPLDMDIAETANNDYSEEDFLNDVGC